MLDVELLLIGRHGVDSFGFPSRYSLFGLGNLAPSHLVLFAHLTLALNSRRLIDEFHATRFAGPVLLVAMGPETAPFVVAADEDLLVVKAHDVG